MSTTNKFYTENGLDYDGTTWITKKLEVSLPSDTASSGYGRSITPRAFRKMVGDKLLQLKERFLAIPQAHQTQQTLDDFLKNERCSVDFGKETVLRILAQENCIGLRLTFCLNDNKEESIIVSGVVEEEVDEQAADGSPIKVKRSFLINRDAYKSDTAATNSQTGIMRSFDDEKGVGTSYGAFAADCNISLGDLMSPDEGEIILKFTDKVFGLI